MEKMSYSKANRLKMSLLSWLWRKKVMCKSPARPQSGLDLQVDLKKWQNPNEAIKSKRFWVPEQDQNRN